MQDLVKSVLEDGVVDADEVKNIEAAVFADGQIDKEEADALFKINDGVAGNDNSPEWNKLFVKAISSYLLDDETSPGVVDVEEGDYLAEKIGADGQIDGVEKELLLHIKRNAKAVESENLKKMLDSLE